MYTHRTVSSLLYYYSLGSGVCAVPAPVSGRDGAAALHLRPRVRGPRLRDGGQPDQPQLQLEPPPRGRGRGQPGTEYA